MIEKGEIVFCNLKLSFKGKIFTLNNVVYKEKNGGFYNHRLLKPLKINEPVDVLSIEILERLGFENKKIGHTKAIKNEEQRNKITGAYE